MNYLARLLREFEEKVWPIFQEQIERRTYKMMKEAKEEKEKKCPRCDRPLSEWPLQRRNVCSPPEWIYCIRRIGSKED